MPRTPEKRRNSRYYTSGAATIDGKSFQVMDWSLSGSSVRGWDWPRPDRHFHMTLDTVWLGGGLAFDINARLIWVDEKNRSAGFEYATNTIRNIHLNAKRTPILVEGADQMPRPGTNGSKPR